MSIKDQDLEQIAYLARINIDKSKFSALKKELESILELVEKINSADTETLSAEEFAEIKHGILAQLNERDNSLGARAKRYWQALGQQDYSFALNERIVQSMQQLTLEQFTGFLQQLLLPDYDAIFLATDSKPEHSHLRFSDPQSLKQQLKQTQIDFDTTDKVI